MTRESATYSSPSSWRSSRGAPLPTTFVSGVDVINLPTLPSQHVKLAGVRDYSFRAKVCLVYGRRTPRVMRNPLGRAAPHA